MKLNSNGEKHRMASPNSGNHRRFQDQFHAELQLTSVTPPMKSARTARFQMSHSRSGIQVIEMLKISDSTKSSVSETRNSCVESRVVDSGRRDQIRRRAETLRGGREVRCVEPLLRRSGPIDITRPSRSCRPPSPILLLSVDNRHQCSRSAMVTPDICLTRRRPGRAEVPNVTRRTGAAHQTRCGTLGPVSTSHLVAKTPKNSCRTFRSCSTRGNVERSPEETLLPGHSAWRDRSTVRRKERRDRRWPQGTGGAALPHWPAPLD